jgi:hypothetical protein
MIMKPSIDEKASEVSKIDGSSEWYTPIFDYIKYGTFPK